VISWFQAFAFHKRNSHRYATGSHLWTFKRQLCQQLALSCFISALLRIGGRTPAKIMFAKNTGRVFMLDFHPAFDSKGMTEFVEPVPFRLTRNLHTFFTPFGVKGDFVASMAAAAQACATPGTNLEVQLLLFFRDQLMVWPWRRMTPAAGTAATLLGPTPSDVRVMARANVDEVLKRLPCIAPTPPRVGSAPQEQLSNVQKVGLYKCNPVAPSRLKAPGFNARACKVKTWFQNLLSKCVNLYRYNKGVIHLVEAALNPKNLCRMEPTWGPWF
jgi:transformation/transcription domain-associated protein